MPCNFLAGERNTVATGAGISQGDCGAQVPCEGRKRE